MDKLNTYVAQFDSRLELLLHRITKPKVVRAILYILIQTALILYVTQFADMLPQSVLKVLSNDFFKLFMLSLVLWTARFSPSISIMVALAFIVTVNYSTTGKYWEMMENIAAEAPAAQVHMGVSSSTSVDTALANAASTVQSQVQETPIVAGVSQAQETITIQPAIIQTTEGPVVVNPSVVVAPVIVASPTGETMSISPSVQTVSVSSETAAPVAAAPVAAEAAPVAAAPVAAAAEPASFNQTGCFPIRNVDMTRVMGTPEEGIGAISDYATFTKL